MFCQKRPPICENLLVTLSNAEKLRKVTAHFFRFVLLHCPGVHARAEGSSSENADRESGAYLSTRGHEESHRGSQERESAGHR